MLTRHTAEGAISALEKLYQVLDSSNGRYGKALSLHDGEVLLQTLCKLTQLVSQMDCGRDDGMGEGRREFFSIDKHGSAVGAGKDSCCKPGQNYGECVLYHPIRIITTCVSDEPSLLGDHDFIMKSVRDRGDRRSSRDRERVHSEINRRTGASGHTLKKDKRPSKGRGSCQPSKNGPESKSRRGRSSRRLRQGRASQGRGSKSDSRSGRSSTHGTSLSGRSRRGGSRSGWRGRHSRDRDGRRSRSSSRGSRHSADKRRESASGLSETHAKKAKITQQQQAPTAMNSRTIISQAPIAPPAFQNTVSSIILFLITFFVRFVIHNKIIVAPFIRPLPSPALLGGPIVASVSSSQHYGSLSLSHLHPQLVTPSPPPPLPQHFPPHETQQSHLVISGTSNRLLPPPPFSTIIPTQQSQHPMATQPNTTTDNSFTVPSMASTSTVSSTIGMTNGPPLAGGPLATLSSNLISRPENCPECRAITRLLQWAPLRCYDAAGLQRGIFLAGPKSEQLFNSLYRSIKDSTFNFDDIEECACETSE
ncbi:unnamed protein product [Didymodactylos carnosus]|uniref:Uncharacterized protein n=1 Tax=Didymodactylos carnosus TaxID=1234261 RepID=A0A814A297_9BILA|nr:unnamed protein product [Didymodactylos carnosus]CAF1262045.1 unnamed protein product [Didymodactylos carnosus]CAF3689004.1 unnamed protein product [Didymodactylos carnosus]CAF4068565.1 unnamed protein product [Didymodactylos carnosus]